MSGSFTEPDVLRARPRCRVRPSFLSQSPNDFPWLGTDPVLLADSSPEWTSRFHVVGVSNAAVSTMHKCLFEVLLSTFGGTHPEVGLLGPVGILFLHF